MYIEQLPYYNNCLPLRESNYNYIRATKYLIMKNILILTLVLLSAQLSAQVNWDDILEQNSARNFLATVYNNGNDMNACEDVNGSPHHLLAGAIEKGATGIIDYMFQYADLDLSIICNDLTILQYAIIYGDEELVQRLLQSGADPNQKSLSGKSAMDIAKEHDKPLVIGYLKSLKR